MSRRRSMWHLTAVVAILAICPSLALASGGGGAHAEPSIWEGGWHNVIWTLAIFVLIVIILGKFAWNPILGVLQQREDFIRDSIENAKKEREESQKLLEQYTQQINRAREEASAITDEGRRDGEEVRRRIESEARSEADAIVKRAKREIQIAHQDAVNDIYDQTAELASRMAGRVLEREVSAADHEQLVSSALEEFKQKGDASSN